MTKKVVETIPTGGNFPFMMLQLSPDGRTLVTTDYNNLLRIWDMTTRKVIRQRSFKGMNLSRGMAFRPDGGKLAVLARSKTDIEDSDPDPLDLPQPRVLLFDLTKDAEPEEIVCPHGWTGGLAFSRDGKMLAVGGAGAVHVFDMTK
jgi:WD40 repeat protein